jgi:predicted DNA-binding protein (MmcQ/YjbR family)
VDIETLREYCLKKNAVTEGFPFDESTLVFKVAGKMFLLVDVDLYDAINLKCDPEKAIELREKYPAVTGGYHMNKKHWNTVQLDGSIPDTLLREWIDHSYNEVVKTLSKKDREKLLG